MYMHLRFYLGAFSLLLNPQQRPLQIEPEADLLESSARRGVPVQLGHFLNLADPLGHLVLESVQEGRVLNPIQTNT